MARTPSFTGVENLRVYMDNGLSVIPTGFKARFIVDYAHTINAVTLLGDGQTGSIVCDIKKSTYAGYPTTASIVASAPPTISSAQKSQDTTITGWTVNGVAGTAYEVYVTSVSTFTNCSLTLKVTRI